MPALLVASFHALLSWRFLNGRFRPSFPGHFCTVNAGLLFVLTTQAFLYCLFRPSFPILLVLRIQAFFFRLLLLCQCNRSVPALLACVGAVLLLPNLRLFSFWASSCRPHLSGQSQGDPAGSPAFSMAKRSVSGDPAGPPALSMTKWSVSGGSRRPARPQHDAVAQELGRRKGHEELGRPPPVRCQKRLRGRIQVSSPLPSQGSGAPQ
jgi:hypothetical protein